MKRVACNYECQLFVYLNNSVISIIVMTKKQCLSYTKKTYAIIKRTIYNRRVFTEIDAMDSREKKKQLPLCQGFLLLCIRLPHRYNALALLLTTKRSTMEHFDDRQESYILLTYHFIVCLQGFNKHLLVGRFHSAPFSINCQVMIGKLKV